MIIDGLSGIMPDKDGFVGSYRGFTRLQGYPQHFSGGQISRSRAELEAAMDATAADAVTRVPSEAEYFAMLDRAGIDLAAVFTENYETSLGVTNPTNAALADFVDAHRDRILGIAGVDPWMADAVQEVEQAKERQLHGVLLSPFKQKLEPDAPRIARVLARCESLGLPVFVHSGVNWFVESAYDVSHPRGIDAMASSFPDLTIVAIHGGWPWVMDMMIVAWRHPNVFVDISTHRPKHMAVPDSGWGPLLHFGSRMLADKIMFGSTWTTIGISPADLIAELRALPVPESAMDKWLGRNAARVFGID